MKSFVHGSIHVALPLLAAIGLAFVPVKFRFVMRLVTLATTLLVALLGVALFWRFATDTEVYQFVTTIPFCCLSRRCSSIRWCEAKK